MFFIYKLNLMNIEKIHHDQKIYLLGKNKIIIKAIFVAHCGTLGFVETPHFNDSRYAWVRSRYLKKTYEHIIGACVPFSAN